MKSAIQGYPKALTRLHNLYHSEKSMYCRGQRNSEEEEWTQPVFRRKNKIRELFEYRVEQMAGELTKTKAYFTDLLHECRKQDTADAHLTLGFLYQHGYGIRKITDRAIEFYTLAAEKGSTDAQFNLASIYHAHYYIMWNYREAFKWYTIAAENGSVYGQSGLAFMYQHGLSVDTDYTKTIYLYTQAAEMRNVKAQISLGCIFRKGEIVDQDLVKAAEWYKRAAKEGSQVAQNCLDLLDRNNSTPSNDESDLSLEETAPKIYTKKGLCTRLRDDVDAITDPVKLNAFKKLASNAMKKDGNAMLEIGLNYYNGSQFGEDKDTAFRWIRKAAKTGLTKAQCFIAEIYKNDDCVKQDYLKSSIWYSNAAKQKDSEARYHLGQLYYQGLGVRKDPLEASRLYTLAAEKKHGDARYELGFLREEGIGLRQDVLEAFKMYTTLAKKNHPEAMFRLARLYESGNGIKPDFEQALIFHIKAAFFGCRNAQFRLGEMYSDRSSSMFSLESAFKYYNMAANQNDPEATYRLAIMYLDGIGVEQDFIQAYLLFSKSSELHYNNAENIFQVPIDYKNTNDIDYDKVADMFALVCKRNISSLEYNLGYHYEHEDTYYVYNSVIHNTTVSLDLSKTWYEAAALKGHPKAQYRLGIMYESGRGVPQDWVQALEYYEKARNIGNTDATYKLAQLYLNGNEVPQDIRRAFYLVMEVSHKDPGKVPDLLLKWNETANDETSLNLKKILKELAKSGNIAIQYVLGIFYISVELLKPDDVLNGIKWLFKASKGGYTNASYHLGLLLEREQITRFFKEVDSFYYEAADKGNEYALNRLAQFHHYGIGTKQDYLKAFDLYTSAANYGHPSAKVAIKITSKLIWENSMDELQNSFKDISLDYDSCLQMWEQIGNQGNPELQYQLGNAYEEMGSSSDLDKAKEWYSKATEFSHGPSFFRLGRLFELGLGVKQDYKKAIELYNQSAMTDNNDALNALGNIYQQGYGIESDKGKALGYYTNAAENGDSKAQFTLGTFYENGGILRKDLLEALRWYSIAASQGNENAHSHLDLNFDDSNLDDQFNNKSIKYLSRLIKLEENSIQPNKSFLGELYFSLGSMYYDGYRSTINYGKAWDCFKISYEEYGENKAATFLNIASGYSDMQSTADYLKKLEMWDLATNHSKKEDVYELGLIYHNGVYGISNASETDEVAVIVEPNIHKAAKYFKMVTDEAIAGM
jgi:TPR repeat protein